MKCIAVILALALTSCAINPNDTQKLLAHKAVTCVEQGYSEVCKRAK